MLRFFVSSLIYFYLHQVSLKGEIFLLFYSHYLLIVFIIYWVIAVFSVLLMTLNFMRVYIQLMIIWNFKMIFIGFLNELISYRLFFSSIKSQKLLRFVLLLFFFYLLYEFNILCVFDTVVDLRFKFNTLFTFDEHSAEELVLLFDRTLILTE